LSLLEDAKALMLPTGRACGIAILKVEHPNFAVQIDELIEAVRGKSVHGSKAAKVLKDRLNATILGDTVRRHANRVCSCPS